MWPACGRRAAVHFYLSLGLVRVCEIESSHMGKNNGNPNLVCEKSRSLLEAGYRVYLFSRLCNQHSQVAQFPFIKGIIHLCN